MRFLLLLCVIDIFSRYACIVPLKGKKDISIVNAFQKIVKESDRSEAKSKGRRPNKIWVDKGSEFYNNSFKKWLKDNDMTCIQYIMKENQLSLKDLLEY